ncbi:MAG: VanZ family protein [Vicinamibacterales bacterium]|nr:VanZ family protein [Vicinamibacterales bacterium]
MGWASGVFLAGSSIGLLDELLQIIWPRRYFDWADVGMNVVAVGLGLLVAIPTWSALNRDA